MGCIIYRNKERLYAYFAGAIDTDGFISIQKTVKKNKSLVPHRYYNAKIGLTTASNGRLLEMLKENFGGNIYSYHPGNPQHHDWSVWRASDKNAREALKVLQPYLLAKKSQAELVIDFVDVCEAQWKQIQRTQKRPYHIPPEMLALREHYWEKIARVNSNAAANTTGVAMQSPREAGTLSEKASLFNAFAIAPGLGIWLHDVIPDILSCDLSFLAATL